jgi:hypothetical protein
MTRVGKVDRNSLPVEFQERFDIIEKSNGYIPNSYLVLGHRPPVLKAFMDLSKAVIRDEGTLDRGFRFLVAYISSSTAGCQFCQAHNIQSAARWGVPDDKLNAIWEYEQSSLFNEGEKAAFGRSAPHPSFQTPPPTISERFSAIRPQIVEIVAGFTVRVVEPFQRHLHTELTSIRDWAAEFGLRRRRRGTRPTISRGDRCVGWMHSSPGQGTTSAPRRDKTMRRAGPSLFIQSHAVDPRERRQACPTTAARSTPTISW